MKMQLLRVAVDPALAKLKVLSTLVKSNVDSTLTN